MCFAAPVRDVSVGLPPVDEWALGNGRGAGLGGGAKGQMNF